MRTLLKENEQSKSKQQRGNSSKTSREELQSTAQRYDKKFQEFVEEVNTKRKLGYKIVEDWDRPYQQTVNLLEEGIPKQLHCWNKLVAFKANFVEEHLKEACKCKAYLDYHWLAHMSKGTQPAMNAEKINAAQAVKKTRVTQLLNGQPSCSNSAK